MRINKENGFDVDWLTTLSAKSIKTLMPEYDINWSRMENSPTYRQYKESGLTRKEFCEKKGISLSAYDKAVRSEMREVYSLQDKELQRRFDKFVSENKDEIYKAQVDAINRQKQKFEQVEKEREKKEELSRKKADEEYLESISQYTSGSEVAVSTVEAEQVEFINSLLKLGYKVKMTAPSMVFLFFDGDTKPTVEQMKKIIPRPELPDDNEGETAFFSRARTMRILYDTVKTEVKGVEIKCGWRLTGYEYPE